MDTLEHRKSIKSYAQAMLDYFGKNGKDTQAFMTELRALHDIDKAEFRMMLSEIGYTL
jgi:hypothetical protein